MLYVTKLIGSDIDSILEYDGLKDSKTFTFVTDLSETIIDVLYHSPWIGMTRSCGQEFDIKDEHWVNLKDYHPVRHFDTKGDCDFKYFIPLTLME